MTGVHATKIEKYRTLDSGLKLPVWAGPEVPIKEIIQPLCEALMCLRSHLSHDLVLFAKVCR